MNYKKDFGWYYISANDKTPSWTGVEYLYNFLITNKTVGPYGKDCGVEECEIGDVVQLSFDGKRFAHSLLIIGKKSQRLDNITIATHTYDAHNRLLSSYPFEKIRFIHIEGIRRY